MRGGGQSRGCGSGPGAKAGAGRAEALRRTLRSSSSSPQVRALQAAGAGIRGGRDQTEGDRPAGEGEGRLRLCPSPVASWLLRVEKPCC